MKKLILSSVILLSSMTALCAAPKEIKGSVLGLIETDHYTILFVPEAKTGICVRKLYNQGHTVLGKQFVFKSIEDVSNSEGHECNLYANEYSEVK